MNAIARLERLPIGSPHFRFLYLLGLGWALDAMDVGLISFTLPALAKEFHLTQAQAGLLGSAGLLGMLLGAAFGGRLADRFGRRGVVAVSLMIAGLGSLLTALAPTPAWLFFFRFLKVMRCQPFLQEFTLDPVFALRHAPRQSCPDTHEIGVVVILRDAQPEQLRPIGTVGESRDHVAVVIGRTNQQIDNRLPISWHIDFARREVDIVLTHRPALRADGGAERFEKAAFAGVVRPEDDRHSVQDHINEFEPSEV